MGKPSYNTLNTKRNALLRELLNGSGGSGPTIPIPLDVNVVNQIDLTTLQTTLTGVLTEVSAINLNTDGIETLLNTVITTLSGLDSDDDAAGLALISTNLGTVISELQDIEADTANLETILGNILAEVTPNATEAKQDAIIVELQSLNTLLGTGINVNVTNQIDLTNVETLLTSISNSVSALPDNTDGIEALLGTIITTLGTLDSDDDGTALALINTSINNAITELQTLVSNTNNQETLLNSIITLLTTGSKTVSYTEETTPGGVFNTIAGAREVSVYFEGIGGTLTGVEFRDRQSTDADDEGGLNSFSGTVPNLNGIDGATRVIIQYVL